MRGFSLIELLVTLGILTVVGTVAVGSYSTVRASGAAQQAVHVTVDATKEAVMNAKNMEYDTAWGVGIGTSSVTVFSGTSYAGRATSRDQVYSLPNGLSVTGVTEAVFAKFSGTPNTTGTTTFSNTVVSSSMSLSLTGVISY